MKSWWDARILVIFHAVAVWPDNKTSSSVEKNERWSRVSSSSNSRCSGAHFLCIILSRETSKAVVCALLLILGLYINRNPTCSRSTSVAFSQNCDLIFQLRVLDFSSSQAFVDAKKTTELDAELFRLAHATFGSFYFPPPPPTTNG